jgi:hypothetical protein
MTVPHPPHNTCIFFVEVPSCYRKKSIWVIESLRERAEHSLSTAGLIRVQAVKDTTMSLLCLCTLKTIIGITHLMLLHNLYYNVFDSTMRVLAWPLIYLNTYAIYKSLYSLLEGLLDKWLNNYILICKRNWWQYQEWQEFWYNFACNLTWDVSAVLNYLT